MPENATFLFFLTFMGIMAQSVVASVVEVEGVHVMGIIMEGEGFVNAMATEDIILKTGLGEEGSACRLVSSRITMSSSESLEPDFGGGVGSRTGFLATEGSLRFLLAGDKSVVFS